MIEVLYVWPTIFADVTYHSKHDRTATIMHTNMGLAMGLAVTSGCIT